jgi:hypothetical protein
MPEVRFASAALARARPQRAIPRGGHTSEMLTLSKPSWRICHFSFEDRVTRGLLLMVSPIGGPAPSSNSAAQFQRGATNVVLDQIANDLRSI